MMYFMYWCILCIDVFFILIQFIMTAVSVTMPFPAGVFFPVFLIGMSK